MGENPIPETLVSQYNLSKRICPHQTFLLLALVVQLL